MNGPTASSLNRTRPNTESACAHCGGLVLNDTKNCPQCGKFPVKLHSCPKCSTIAADKEANCPRCGRMFEPEGDYL